MEIVSVIILTIAVWGGIFKVFNELGKYENNSKSKYPEW